MDGVDERADVVDGSTGQHTVTEIEDVTGCPPASARIAAARRRISAGGAKSAAGSRFPWIATS